jgi:hypothetical protein
VSSSRASYPPIYPSPPMAIVCVAVANVNPCVVQDFYVVRDFVDHVVDYDSVDYRIDCHDHAIHHQMDHPNDLVVDCSMIHDDRFRDSVDDDEGNVTGDDVANVIGDGEANVTDVVAIVICPFL